MYDPNFHRSGRLNKLLENLIILFKKAPRIGAEEDESEGSYYIQISDALAKELTQELIEVEKIWNQGTRFL